MRLKELHSKLIKANATLYPPVKVLIEIDKEFFYPFSFKSFVYANRLILYLVGSKISPIKTLFSLINEVEHQLFLYQYAGDPEVIAPQIESIKENSLINPLQLCYNKDKNTIILK